MADETPNKTIALSLPPDLISELDRLAEDDTRNRSNMATVLLREAIARREEQVTR